MLVRIKRFLCLLLAEVVGLIEKYNKNNKKNPEGSFLIETKLQNNSNEIKISTICEHKDLDSFSALKQQIVEAKTGEQIILKIE